MRATSFAHDYGVLALVNGEVYKKGSVLRFVVDLGVYVGLGLGLRKVIEENNFSLSNVHGCFLLMNDGQVYSHSDKEENKKFREFGFENGDQIEVETNDKELLIRETSGKWNFTMNIQLSDDDWRQACFCVYLYSK